MRGWSIGTVIVGLLGLGLPSLAAAAPQTYTLDSGRLEVVVRSDPDALMGGHDHVLVSTGFTGKVTWDPEDPSACRVSITMPVQSLVVDPPGARARHGFEGETGDGDKDTIKKNALGKSQLDAAGHPNITYEASSCAAQGSKTRVVGKLTIRGVAKQVTTVMTVSADGATFSGKGSFDALHTDFGFQPHSALLGALRNDNRLSFVIDVRGRAG